MDQADVFCLTAFQIGTDGIQPGMRTVECLKIIAVQDLRQRMVDKFRVEQITCLDQGTHAHVARIAQIVAHDAESAPALLRYIAASVTDACRYADQAVYFDIMVEESIQHAAGIGAAHASSF